MLLDRLTKIAAEAWLAGRGRISWLGDTLRLELAQNTGAFLGLGSSWPVAIRTSVFTVGAVAVAAGLLWAALRSHRTSALHAAALALVAGGGLGNLWDRLAAGAVTDFLNLGVGPLRTGIFNAADLAIVAGLAMLVWPRPAPAAKTGPGPASP